MALEIIISIVVLAFIMEYIDAAFGMGYGTLLTPILILTGFHPLEVISAILFSNIFLGFMAGLFHHKLGNVDFGIKSKDSKIMIVLVVFGIIGVIIASFVALELPENILMIYIGLLLLAIGLSILIKRKSKHKFSWLKIMGLGTLAAFNKGMSSAGYGSVLVGGQILSGIKTKKAIGVALLAEAVVSLVGVLIYARVISINWSLASSLLIGGILSVPLAGYTVQKFDPEKLKVIIGIAHIIFGLAVLIRLMIL